MAEQNIKTIKTRIINKHATAAVWDNTAFVPLQGEWIIYDKDSKYPYERAKIGDGTKTVSELPFVTHSFYEGVIGIDGETTNAIFEAKKPEGGYNNNDVFVIKTPIAENKYSYTSYVYDAENSVWKAMDGNYNAKNVYFDEDFVFTTKIGTVQTLTNGNTTVAAEGKNIKDFFAGIFAKEAYPSATQPSVSWNTEPTGTVEVGTEITPTYDAKLNAGSYTYGPPTGITASSWTIDIEDLSDADKTTSSGSFSSFTVVDGMSGYAKIKATATYGAGSIPKTNIGNEYPSKQISAGSKSTTSMGYTGYRAWFYGYKAGGSTIAISEIDSDNIRALTSANGSFVTSMSTTNMQQMFFAAPAGLVKSVAVTHSVNDAPQTVNKTTVYVKGANDYVVSEVDATENNTVNGMKYDLFYVSNDNANNGAATYTITTTKA